MAGMFKASSAVHGLLHSDPVFSSLRRWTGTRCIRGRQRREEEEARRRRGEAGTEGGRGKEGRREEEKTTTVYSVTLSNLVCCLTGDDGSHQLIPLSPNCPTYNTESPTSWKSPRFWLNRDRWSLRKFGDRCLLRLGVLPLFLSPCLILP